LSDDIRMRVEKLEGLVALLMEEMEALYSASPQIGTLIPFIGDHEPPGWLIADGRDLSQFANPVYDSLKQLLGTRFNRSTDKPPICRLPDLTGRVIVGVGDYKDGTFEQKYIVGGVGGQAQNQLKMDNVPRHSHGTAGAWHPTGANIPDAQPQAAAGGAALHSGGGLGSWWEYPGYRTSAEGRDNPLPVENRPPFIALTYIIKYARSKPSVATHRFGHAGSQDRPRGKRHRKPQLGTTRASGSQLL
jgi:microcystin-dependent protein